MNKIARIGTVAALLVAGCSMLERDGDGTQTAGTPCTHGSSGICVISVVVNSCTSISANPDVALVASGDRGDVVWKLPGGWKFASQGIVFRNPHSDFSNPRGGNSQEFRWHNAHQVKNKGHKYTIHITDGRQTCSHDPTIMN